MWEVNGDNYYEAMPPSPTVSAIPAGMYSLGQSKRGFYLEKTTLTHDDLLIIPDSPAVEILEEIKKFWLLEDEFKKRGFVHKRGMLLHGVPGTGKTATVNHLLNLVVKQCSGVALIVPSVKGTTVALDLLRKIEPDRPVIVVFEDLDSYLNDDEEDLLSLLDGQHQCNNVVFLATTNYLNKLPQRIINRPSRFDAIIKVEPPSDSARRYYLSTKEPSLTEEELSEWVVQTKDLSLAHLKELIILNRCYKIPLDKALARFAKMHLK